MSRLGVPFVERLNNVLVKWLGLRLWTEKQLGKSLGPTLGTELQMMLEVTVGLRLWDLLGSIPWSICTSIQRKKKVSSFKLDVIIESRLIKTQNQKKFNFISASCIIFP